MIPMEDTYKKAIYRSVIKSGKNLNLLLINIRLLKIKL